MGGGRATGEVADLEVQLQRLKHQLAEEQQLRRRAEETVEVVAADRNRLQKARDELAAALLAAERRASEAEEEQLQAEAHAAALEAALQEQQQAAESVAGARTASNGALSPAEHSPGGRASAAATRAVRHLQSGTADSAMAADLEILLTELDQERQHSEELVRLLEAAEREAVTATTKLLKAEQRVKQLESGSSSKGRGLFGAMKKSASATNLVPAPGTSVVDGSGSGSAGEPAAAGAAAEETVAMLQQRIAALKASRDKLIGAFDAQAAEIERLSGDNAALAESVTQLRDVAAKWEAQAQDSLAQNERLKDLLEESATWSLPPAASPGVGAEQSSSGTPTTGSKSATHIGDPRSAVGPGSEGDAAGVAAQNNRSAAALADLCQRFERELLLEKARSAQLDMQVRALCMELTRAAQSSSQLQAALVPMLGGIEARLVQVLGMRPRAAVAQAAAS